MRLAQDLEISLTVAVTEAVRMGHEYAGMAHLLHALTLDERAREILRHAGADTDALHRRLTEYLETELDRLPAERSSKQREPRLSLALERTLARAGSHTVSSGRDHISGEDFLAAMFFEPESQAVQILSEQGVSRLDVVSYLAHGVSRADGGRGGPGAGRGGGALPAGGDPAFEGDFDDDLGGDLGGGQPSGAKALAAFTQDLSALAESGDLDPLIGREDELRRTLHILQRRRKNNPLFVGDPGVGKTALAEGLASRIAEGRVPERFRKARVLRLDLGALIAGTRYRGDFEARMKAVLGALETVDDPILFIDEIHTVIGAGSAGRGSLDVSNLLKPALQHGRLRCIGATTWEDLRQGFERDAALARRFQRVELSEPPLAETVSILEGLQERYEEHHGVRYTLPSLQAAAELAERYLRERKNPDKAIDLMDEAGAAVALAGRKRVGVPDMERIVATMARVPAVTVRGDDRQRLADLQPELERWVYGQTPAIERLVAAIKVARAGLRDAEKPVGSFLLTGPTGVGKTETARRLAEVLGVAFLRFDMSEYRERHTVSRLVGAPPGYVGYDRGGLLTEAVSQSPHAVLLLDEIEKAHDDVFNLLLQVMDHGALTDTNGKKTDFRHVILLMTSNVGAREMSRRQPGFGAGRGAEAAISEGGDGATGEIDAEALTEDPRNADADRAIERLFSPEFRNRLDARLRFRPLTPRIMERIVDKMITELAPRLLAQKVLLEITDEARTLLAERGHDPAYGARPLARVLDETVKRPLTDALLFGELSGGGKALVTLEDGEIALHFET